MSQDMKPADALRSIIERAATDPVFRASLKENPRLTLEAELTRLSGADARVPDGFELVVLEDTPTRMHLVLPPLPAAGQRELSDAELDGVAGGATVIGCMPNNTKLLGCQNITSLVICGG